MKYVQALARLYRQPEAAAERVACWERLRARMILKYVHYDWMDPRTRLCRFLFSPRFGQKRLVWKRLLLSAETMLLEVLVLDAVHGLRSTTWQRKRLVLTILFHGSPKASKRLFRLCGQILNRHLRLDDVQVRAMYLAVRYWHPIGIVGPVHFSGGEVSREIGQVA